MNSRNKATVRGFNSVFGGVITTLLISILASLVTIPTAHSAPDNSYKTGTGSTEAAYLNGTYVQAGIAKNGKFGPDTAAPSVGGVTWNPSGGRDNIGFVADRNRDGSWLDTDFFYPGTPLEAWAIQYDGTQGVFDHLGSAAGATFSFSDVDVTSTSTSVTHTTTWGDFTIAQTYSARKGSGTFVKDQQIDISVTVTNNGASAVSDLRYARTVDPDNLKDIDGSYETTNKIVSQYGTAGKSYSLVSATKSDSRQTPAGTSYVGLISADSRSKVSLGGFGFESDFKDMFTDGYTRSSYVFRSTVGATRTEDRGISIMFSLGAIAAGGTKTFDLAYVLSENSASDTAGESVGTSTTPAPVVLPTSYIMFAQNGADTNSLPQTELSGESKPLWKNIMTRAGYTFAGWNTKADGTGTAYADSAIFKFDLPNYILYAQWKLIQTKPTITWATPAAIVEGTALSSTQLNALGSVPGTYTYSPAATSVPAVGKQTLKVTFVPTDPKFETIGASVEIEVLAKATLTWATPAAIVEGTALSSTQLNALGSVPGTYTYSPAATSVPAVGKNTLKVVFTPTDSRLTPVSAEVVIEVTAKPVVIPPAPGAPVSPTYSISGGARTTIIWGAGKDAATYTVLVDGKSTCSVATLSCEVEQLLGPKNIVTVTSVAANTKTSAAIKANYVAPTESQVLSVVNFDTAKSVLKSSETAKLRAFATIVKAAGYTSLTVYGHTDSMGGVDNQKLSIARAKTTITYLKKLLPSVKFVISGFAASEPVGDNSTNDGKAANRRAEIYIP